MWARLLSVASIFIASSVWARGSSCADLYAEPSGLAVAAGDFGIGRSALIRKEVQSIRGWIQGEARAVDGFASQLPETEVAVNRFRFATGLYRGSRDVVTVPSRAIDSWEKIVGPQSIEVLYVPGADVPYLPEKVRHVGHIAVRVGNMVYHQTGGSGFRKETLQQFILETKADHKVYGTVLKASPREREIMRRYFDAMFDKQVPYSFLLNNCSEAACRAMSYAGVMNLPRAAGLDPFVMKKIVARRSDRVVVRTVYNAEKEGDWRELRNAVLRNRMFFYGVPVGVTGAAGTGLGYGIWEASELLSDWISEVRDSMDETGENAAR